MSETIFTTQVAVQQWLTDNGWQLSLSQFNKHCREGLLRKGKDGKYHQKAIEKYATLHVKKSETGQKVNEFEEIVRRQKLEMSLEKEQLDLDKARHEKDRRDGKFIAKEEFELAIVSRAVAFMAHLNHSIQSNVQDWIDLVEGDQQRAPELVDAMSKIIEQRMGDFAADVEFDVILETLE